MSRRAVPGAQPCPARPRSSARRQVPRTLGTASGTPWWPAGRMVSSLQPLLWDGWAEPGTGTPVGCVRAQGAASHLIKKPVEE